jgi:hypothetical protein
MRKEFEMKLKPRFKLKELFSLKIEQWIPDWDKVQYSPRHYRRKPTSSFYLFKLSAAELKALSGIQRRTTEGVTLRSRDLGIQRRHEEARSKRIREYIQFGYPWSELSQAKRESGRYDDLRKPGWLPTAIVVNILNSGDKRRGVEIDERDLISVEENNAGVTIKLPKSFTGSKWKPSSLHPLEVIDGQHRLWAFGDDSLDGSFELPVVAFHGLDISWQAYLFWSINITPKRINPSLAFDLYPLLRTEDWLEKFEGHSIYRETRAQELTEALWAHPRSPWYQHINMLGETGLKKTMVTQAGWIRSLMATFVKTWEGRGTRIGGLFGAPLGNDKEVLHWSRAQQAAFLILAGTKMKEATKACREKWAKIVRASREPDLPSDLDPAFHGSHTLLNTDQGIRGFLYITNDLCWVSCIGLELEEWGKREDAGAGDIEAVNNALESLSRQKKISAFLEQMSTNLASYDWRTASAGGLSEEEISSKLVFRGSGGYKELRRQLLRHLERSSGDISRVAKNVLKTLGYD